MADPINNATEINTQSTQPSNKATVRAASVKGSTSNAQNATENSDMKTISKADYDRIMSELQTSRAMMREIYLRLDSMLHVQKQQLSQSLNQTVRSHNLIADMEGIKDSITTQSRI
jgi:ribosomal protein S20